MKALVVALLLTLVPITAAYANDGNGNGNDQSDGKNGRGKCEKAQQCNDQDFSPSFDKSPVIVCLPSSTCNFN